MPDGKRGPVATSASGLAWRALLLLAVLWLAGIATRSVWTPDEPREYALSFNMLAPSQHAVPMLGGMPFVEKPPLTYWLAAASMQLFGVNPVAARLPNLLYGLIATLCTAWLAAEMVVPARRARAFTLALVIAGTSCLCLQHTVWLATDAPLLAASAAAWLGLWRALAARGERERTVGYLWFALGLAAAFLAKNLLGLIAPLLAFTLLLVWQRRWRELRRWQPWAAAALVAALIGAWLLAVAQQPDGARLLRIILWDNSIGRFLPVASAGDYRTGHLNSPGKLLMEVLLGLMPWLPLALVAWFSTVRQTWRGGAQRVAAQFLTAAALPLIALLSFSSTVRDVYALPCMVPLTAAIAVYWVSLPVTNRVANAAAMLTRLLLYACGMVAALLCAALLWVSALPWTVQATRWLLFAAAVAALLFAARPLQRQETLCRGLACFAIGLTALLVLGSRVIEPGQDLRPIARQAASLAAGRPLLLTTRDETMSAALDYSTSVHGLLTDDFAAAAQAQPTALALVEVETDRLTPTMRAQLARLRPSMGHLAAARPEPFTQALLAAGWSLLHDLPNPGGRHYQLLAPSSEPATR